MEVEVVAAGVAANELRGRGDEGGEADDRGTEKLLSTAAKMPARGWSTRYRYPEPSVP